MNRTRAGRLRASAIAALMAVLALATLSGCTAARDTLGTNSSPCFRALALAKDAVHNRGTFSGVRLVNVATLKAPPAHFKATLQARSLKPLHNVCLVSYKGTFTPDQVERPAGKSLPPGTGHVAIVVVSTPQNVLLATFVLQHDPVRFRHVASPAGGDRPGAGPGGASVTVASRTA